MMDLEQQLNQILSDPDSINAITQIAQSFQAASQTDRTADSSSQASPQMGQLLHLLQTFQQAGQSDPQQQALLDALRPYVTPSHCQRLERAMQMAQLSRLAGLAITDLNQD